MAEEKPSGINPILSIIVLLVIWLTAISFIWGNNGIRDFFSNIFHFSPQINTYNDVVVTAYNNGSFGKANFSASGRVNINDIASSPNSPYIFYAATDNGIYMTSDSGNTWAKITLPKDIDSNINAQRIFTSSRRPSEISFLIMNSSGATVYSTEDNFSSVQKTFSVDKDNLKSIVGSRTISTILPLGDRFIIGTKK